MIVPDRLEFIDDIAFVANSVQARTSKGGVLETQRDLAGVLLTVEGRVAITVAVTTSEHADSPYSIVDTVRVSGVHKQRKVKEIFYELRGPDIRELAMLQLGRAPYSTGALGVTVANHDFRFHLPLWFIPRGKNVPIAEALKFVIPASDYDGLTLEIQWGDALSLYVLGGATVAFSAYGSATGSPRARVHGIYAQWGLQGRPFQAPGLIWRSYRETTSADLAANQTDYRVMNLLTGNLLRSLLIKTGVKATVTGGNNAYASRSNTILGRHSLVKGTNDLLRSYSDFHTSREHGAQQQGIVPDDGYALIDFAGQGDLSTVFPEPSNADADFYLKADITGAASQAILIASEEIRVKPPGW